MRNEKAYFIENGTVNGYHELKKKTLRVSCKNKV